MNKPEGQGLDFRCVFNATGLQPEVDKEELRGFAQNSCVTNTYTL
ncbi:hypothetical protein [Undibacterium terreum]|nr:hypothetical protein [Undibacterium terreum]